MRARTRAWGLGGAAVVTVAVFALLPPSLDCPDPVYASVSPDARHTITVCRRSSAFAMPGGASDAPGWVALRDARGFVAGVVSLSMVQSVTPAEWMPASVHMPLTANIDRSDPQPPILAWLNDRLWKWRAAFGLVPTDDEFR